MITKKMSDITEKHITQLHDFFKRKNLYGIIAGEQRENKIKCAELRLTFHSAEQVEKFCEE